MAKWNPPKFITRGHFLTLVGEVCKMHLDWCEATPRFGGMRHEDVLALAAWKNHVLCLAPRDFVLLLYRDVENLIGELNLHNYIIYEGGAYFAADAILAQSLRQLIGRQ